MLFRKTFAIGIWSLIIVISFFQTSFLASANISLDEVFSKMSIKDKIGQILMPEIRTWNKNPNIEKEDSPLTVMNKEVSDLISNYHFGGIILFRENLQNNSQIIKLTDAMQEASTIPILIATDQEGGVVTRLQNGTNMVGNMALGATRDTELTTKTARAMGEELKVLGINLDFAPVVDVNSNQDNPVIGVRSFSSDPYLVSRLGISYLKGLKDAGVIACLKHFPGHGDTVSDTHLSLAIVNHDINELNRIDLFPFKQCIQYGVDFVMIAHVIVPALDNSKIYSKKLKNKIPVPSTLSYKIITEMLRKKYKFNGVIITDAMNMKAISDSFGSAQATIMAILAGANMVTMPIVIKSKKDIPHLNMFYLKLENEYNTNKQFAKALDDSVKKILNVKAKYGLLLKQDTTYDKKSEKERILTANKTVNSVINQSIEKEGSLLSITCLANKNKYLPFLLKENSKILIIDDSNERISSLSDSIRALARNNKIQINISSIFLDKKFVLREREEQIINKSDFIILCTYNLNISSSATINSILNFIEENHKAYVVVATRNVYDIAYLSNCGEYIAIYGAVSYDRTGEGLSSVSINLKELPRFIFYTHLIKNFSPVGRLPVDIIKEGNKIYKIGDSVTY